MERVKGIEPQAEPCWAERNSRIERFEVPVEIVER
jgi:hypothetical protein